MVMVVLVDMPTGVRTSPVSVSGRHDLVALLCVARFDHADGVFDPLGHLAHGAAVIASAMLVPPEVVRRRDRFRFRSAADSVLVVTAVAREIAVSLRRPRRHPVVYAG